MKVAMRIRKRKSKKAGTINLAQSQNQKVLKMISMRKIRILVGTKKRNQLGKVSKEVGVKRGRETKMMREEKIIKKIVEILIERNTGQDPEVMIKGKMIEIEEDHLESIIDELKQI